MLGSILQTELHPHLSNRTVLRLRITKRERKRRDGEEERGRKGSWRGRSGKQEATSQGEMPRGGEAQRVTAENLRIVTHMWNQKTLKGIITGQEWLCRPLIPALRRRRQEELCEFKIGLVHMASSRTVRAVQWNSTRQNEWQQLGR